jgi:hypothetical protein
MRFLFQYRRVNPSFRPFSETKEDSKRYFHKEVTVMRIVTIFIFIFVILSSIILLSACSQSLTEETAVQLIRESKGYPKPVSIILYNVKQDTPLGQEIMRLINEKYLLDQKSYMAGYQISDKGKNFVRKCVWNGVYKNFEVFEPITHIKDFIEIKEILINDNKNEAVVKYIGGILPNSYFDKLKSLDKKSLEKAVKRRNFRSFDDEVYLKKWDKGWRSK